MICKFCGNENDNNQKTCSICGKSLESANLNTLVGMQPQLSQMNRPAPAPVQRPAQPVQPAGGYAQPLHHNHNLMNDTGGGVQVGPQLYGARALGGEQESKKSKNALAVALVILMMLAAAALTWFLFFAPEDFSLPSSCSMSQAEVISDTSDRTEATILTTTTTTTTTTTAPTTTTTIPQVVDDGNAIDSNGEG